MGSRYKADYTLRHRPRATEEEMGALRSHVVKLHVHAGMTYQDIADDAGVSDTTVQYIHLGHRYVNQKYHELSFVRRDTLERVMAVLPSPPPPRAGDMRKGGRRGAHVDMLPVKRRVQALVADGFNMRAIADALGYKSVDSVWDMAHGHKRSRVMATTRESIVQVFDKLAGVKPEDMGLNPEGIHYARTVGVRNGWAPSHCWDRDTIDDPYTIPEWTGECGTASGYRIHQRDDIPPCQPCKDSIAEYRREEKSRRKK